MRTICSFFLAFFLFTPVAHANSPETIMVEVEEQKLPTVLQNMKENHPNLNVQATFQETFYGFSVAGAKEELAKVATLPSVKSISPVTSFQVDTNTSIPFVMGDLAKETQTKTLTGKGVKIGIIDTGIDYHHPDLKANYKGGYDTVDKDNDPMETKKGQGIPTVHGTHVAGIIAANGKLQGIAPQASIYAYRALGSGGVGTTETVVQAIEKAVQDKVDVINLSLGNDVNGPDWPTSVALNKAVEKGIVAVTASGNSGPKNWTIGSPGTATGAISVGASSPPMKLPYIVTSRKKAEFPVQTLKGSSAWNKVSGTVVDVGLGDNLGIGKLTGKIALIKRGRLTFTEKVENAQKAGAKAVIIYNNLSGNFSGKLTRKLAIPVVSLSMEDGSWLKKQITLGNKRITTVFHQQADKLASFSSRGPVTVTWEIKPDVLAPGVAIYSTIPDGYSYLQGTSMASPHVAGAVALLKEKYPNWRPNQFKAALMNTAKPLAYHVYEQGAGRIQIDKALNTKTLVYPSALSLGIIHSRKHEEVTIFLENLAKEKKKYTISTSSKNKQIHWQLPKTVYVKAGEKKKVKLNLSFNHLKGMNEGTIQVQEGENTVHIPYLIFGKKPNYPSIMGFQMKKKKGSVWEYEVYLPEGADELGIALYDPETFAFHSFLDVETTLPQGAVKREITIPKRLKGIYRGIIFSRKGKKEDAVETTFDFSRK